MGENVRPRGEFVNEKEAFDENTELLQSLRLTMDKRIELVLDVVVIVLGLFILVTARNIRMGTLGDPLTARGLPYLTGILLVIAGITLVAMRIKNWSQLPGNFVPAEGKDDEEGHPASWLRAFGIILASIVSVWLLDVLGYIIATPLFLFVFLLLMGERSWVRLIGFPILYPFIWWYIFSQILKVILPLGPLSSIARSWGLLP